MHASVVAAPARAIFGAGIGQGDIGRVTFISGGPPGRARPGDNLLVLQPGRASVGGDLRAVVRALGQSVLCFDRSAGLGLVIALASGEVRNPASPPAGPRR